jgi:aryl-alcohol dehydrogenase-like predicted oxidoreductase
LQGYEWLRETAITPQNIAKVRQLEPIAKDLGCTLAQLALAWCRRNPNVSTVITGATRPEQVKENMGSLEFVAKLDSDVIERIDEALGNKPEP